VNKPAPAATALAAAMPAAAVVLAAAVLAAAALSGCGSAPRPSTVDTRSTVDGVATVRLSARLASPTDVALQWTGTDAGAAGRTVEYADRAGGDFVVLEFVAPSTATYTHPDLMPDTTFYYRVRPYYGPASAAVAVDLPPGEYDDAAHENDPDWAAPSARPEPGVARSSIRAAPASIGPAVPSGAPAPGAPTDLRATVRDPNGISFTWTDHATDEDGYLLEVKPAGAASWRVAAVLDRDVNADGLVTLPNEKRASYRVRAFYFGPPSNVVQETTGKG
jgi:hypothetical protein